MHEPVDPNVRFPALEEEILEWWEANDIPSKALTFREGSNEWVFYEGPPYANNPPGIHHVLARTYKDVYNRYRTAKGLHVPRKAGWDCHGLPVEFEVEKSLGFSHKQEIVEYGVERFNETCRRSVTEYITQWERMTDRIGFWLDYDAAYFTMSNEYIESVWWSLATLHSKGLLYEDDKVTPYCPRCETPLSDHELGQPDVYQEVDDPGVTLAFPLQGGARAGDTDLEGAALLLWTTTPWTLISNLAAAVHPEVTYALVEFRGRRLVLAQALLGTLADPDAPDAPRLLGTLRGADLVGLRYRPPFDYAARALQADEQTRPAAEDNAWRVLAADFVNVEEGTGIVHLAPAFGADDLDACRRAGIPTFNPVDRSGAFDRHVPEYRGRFVKDADPEIVERLRENGSLVAYDRYLHSYPHCWRCRSPLLYYALRSWYIRTTAHRERLLEVNASVNWFPEHIRDGRYGNWLANNVDWSLSRHRFWGTPLPIWRCAQGHDQVFESVAELGKAAGRDLSGLDLHRPFVDEIELACPECGAAALRVPDVIDVWYDSGAMPFAQYGYPHRNLELFRRRFPADFISEAIDQTRGWFYSLMAEGVLLFDRSPYRNVVCLELIVDEQGRKMSKSLGNVVDPWEVFGRFGADAVRFFLIASSPPASVKRVSLGTIEQVVRGPFLTLWNVYRLYVLYANIDGFHPDSWPEIAARLRPSLDRWILSELHQLVSEVDEALETYDSTRAARRITEFIEDLSNWYVRRSRRRFWRQATKDAERADKAAAYWTLWSCLVTLSRLLAPFTPFLSEALYRNLVTKLNPRAPESVHLVDFPVPDASLIDPAMAQGMAVVRTLVSLGRSARTEAGVKVRQPLGEAVLLVPEEFQDAVAELADQIIEELNVRSIRYAEEAGALVQVTLRPAYPEAGPAFGPRVRDLAKALEGAADAEVIAEALESGEEVEIALEDGEVLTVAAQHVEIRREPAEGTAFAYQAPFGISLDLSVTPDLRREGVVRELVHQLQNVRRQQGLEVTDRIDLKLWAPEDLLEALRNHETYVREELLAASLETAPLGQESADAQTIAVDGTSVRLVLEPA